jgi:hypothetical protein
MGRHTQSAGERAAEARSRNPALARLRSEAEARGKVETVALGAAAYACAAASGAALALVAYLGMYVTGNLEHSDSVVHYTVPKTQPTDAFNGKGFEAPTHESQAILQNPDCWIGVPGATCGARRTFLGQ